MTLPAAVSRLAKQACETSFRLCRLKKQYDRMAVIQKIVVEHRLTTIRNCDKIYEIREGKAVEREKAEVLSGI